MNWFDRFRGKAQPRAEPEAKPIPAIAVGAKDEAASTMTYNDKSITYSGDLASYDYDSILRDKQRNINSLYELADYYVDADPIFRGIINGVYVPFSLSDDFRLVGANEQVKEKYLEYYDRIHLKDRMRSIFYQYFKYGNVYTYLMEDGNIITLPVHLVRIANVMIGGEPLLEFNCRSMRDDMRQQGQKAQKDFLEDEDLKVRLEGFPEEVADAINKGSDWVQMNPENTFVMQGLKEDWMRYAIPMVSGCLPAFRRKALIAQYESALLNLGAHSFVHVAYGDAKSDVMPDITQLNAVNSLFKRAMTGAALATTNHLCKAEVIQPNLNEMFSDDKYRDVNAEILSAGGISGIIVSGRAEDGSNFASAQVSMQTAAMRIKQAREDFCELMNRVNARLNGKHGSITHSAPGNIPQFTFPPVDLADSQKFQEVCRNLWEKGVVSTRTMLQMHGYDMDQELERKKSEEPVVSPIEKSAPQGSSEGRGKQGRPEMDSTERNSDPLKSQTGKQPKPSNPEGSL